MNLNRPLQIQRQRQIQRQLRPPKKSTRPLQIQRQRRIQRQLRPPKKAGGRYRFKDNAKFKGNYARLKKAGGRYKFEDNVKFKGNGAQVWLAATWLEIFRRCCSGHGPPAAGRHAVPLRMRGAAASPARKFVTPKNRLNWIAVGVNE